MSKAIYLDDEQQYEKAVMLLSSHGIRTHEERRYQPSDQELLDAFAMRIHVLRHQRDEALDEASRLKWPDTTGR